MAWASHAHPQTKISFYISSETLEGFSTKSHYLLSEWFLKIHYFPFAAPSPIGQPFHSYVFHITMWNGKGTLVSLIYHSVPSCGWVTWCKATSIAVCFRCISLCTLSQPGPLLTRTHPRKTARHWEMRNKGGSVMNGSARIPDDQEGEMPDRSDLWLGGWAATRNLSHFFWNQWSFPLPLPECPC